MGVATSRHGQSFFRNAFCSGRNELIPPRFNPHDGGISTLLSFREITALFLILMLNIQRQR